MKPAPKDGAERLGVARCLESEPAAAVTDLDYGRYLVLTASASAYILEVRPESSTLVRSPEAGTVTEWEAASLRRDREVIPLLGIIRLRLGVPAVFRIDVRGDGIETTRTTTPVRVIRRLPE